MRVREFVVSAGNNFVEPPPMTQSELEERAIVVFGDPVKAHDWLSTWNETLQAKPMDLLGNEVDTQRVLRVLVSIEHGLPI